MHHMRQSWLVVNRTCRNRADLGLFQENAFESIVCKTWAIALRSKRLFFLPKLVTVTERLASIDISKKWTMSMYYPVACVHIWCFLVICTVSWFIYVCDVCRSVCKYALTLITSYDLGTVVGGLLAWCPWGWHQLEVTLMGIRRPR